MLVIDSIQTMVSADSASAPGSVSQVRQSASAIIRHAKTTGLSVFLVGHVTKDGTLAGPRVLEHMVDTVLSFEGDRQHEYRLLRAMKNRFGSVNELGVFEMRQTGMFPVANPSETLLSQRARGASGSVVFCAMHGSRPILCDLQALAARSFYNMPKRTVGGLDSGRVALLLAVMEKRAGKKLYDQDVYVSVAGGLELDDPAADLAVCLAVASSLEGFHAFAEALRHGRNRPVRRGAPHRQRGAARGRVHAAGLYGNHPAPAEPEKPAARQKRGGHRRGYADAGAGRGALKPSKGTTT